jgi:hypothetical protein
MNCGRLRIDGPSISSHAIAQFPQAIKRMRIAEEGEGRNAPELLPPFCHFRSGDAEFRALWAHLGPHGYQHRTAGQSASRRAFQGPCRGINAEAEQ